MAASEHLSPLQFSHEVNNAGIHTVYAVDPASGNRPVGKLEWEGADWDTPGRISDLNVNESHRRRGVATSMYHFANSAPGVDVRPQHSDDRTNAGDAWARSVGGELPPNTRPEGHR